MILSALRRIGVFRALQLGDMLCVVPALRSLRAGCPQAEITLVGLPWARAFAERYGACVDRFIEFPGHRDMPEQRMRPERWPAYLQAVQSARFDLALQLHGSGRVTNRLLGEWGARATAGFCLAPCAGDDPRRFLAWDEREHEVLRYLRLMRHLGLPDRGTELDWPERPADLQDAAVRQELRERRPFVVVHPGARMHSRRWPVARFAAVADALAERGWRVLVTGAADEAALAAELIGAMRMSARNLAGATSLGGLAALIRRAALVVCNDTGVSHVAAAVGTPSVVVCSGADPGRWAPLAAERHTVLHHPVDCRPCMHQVCPIGHPCATGVQPAAVLDAALKKLATTTRTEEVTA